MEANQKKMIVAASVTAVVAVLGATAIAAAISGGGGKKATASTTTSVPAPSTTVRIVHTRATVPTTATTSTSVPSTRGAIVPGVGCETLTHDKPTPVAAPETPARNIASLTLEQGDELATYGARPYASDVDGQFSVLGPRGWECQAYTYVTGGVSLAVFPPAARPQFSARYGDAADGENYTGPAVRVGLDSLGHGSGVSEACRVFLDDPSVVALRKVDPTILCRTEPGRTVRQISTNEYRFTDGDGTQGVGVMHPDKNEHDNSRFAIVTCTPANGQAGLCQAILDDYAARYLA